MKIEKLETIISRGDQNTRARDYCDVYTLVKLQLPNIEIRLLKKALMATVEKRGSEKSVKDYEKIMHVVKDSER